MCRRHSFKQGFRYSSSSRKCHADWVYRFIPQTIAVLQDPHWNTWTKKKKKLKYGNLTAVLYLLSTWLFGLSSPHWSFQSKCNIKQSSADHCGNKFIHTFLNMNCFSEEWTSMAHPQQVPPFYSSNARGMSKPFQHNTHLYDLKQLHTCLCCWRKRNLSPG